MDEDLEHHFIQVIRELYVNQLLAYYNNRPVKCSELGHLYYADDCLYSLDTTEALKVWEWLHENRADLEIFKTTFWFKGLFMDLSNRHVQQTVSYAC